MYRSGDVWPGSLLSQVTKRTTLDQILELVPDIAVADLEAMLDVARDKLVPAVRARGGPLWLGPVFDGSQWVAADADLIAAGLLIDVKTGAGTKRKDGSRYNGLDKQTLYQLLGYLLFDFSDAYGIREVGLYAARYGQLTTWPVVDLLQELAPEPGTLANLRERCAAVVKEPAARGHHGVGSGDEMENAVPDTEVDTAEYRGVCNCGACYEFATTILPGFADFVEAHCPRCGASLGRFREDMATTIVVRAVEEPAR